MLRTETNQVIKLKRNVPGAKGEEQRTLSTEEKTTTRKNTLNFEL